MRCRWVEESARSAGITDLAAGLGISEVLARCLVNRGLGEEELARRYLEPRLKQLADPFLLPNMEAAVERLYRAREGGEALVIFGDYDVDGVSATALLAEVLRQLGWEVGFYLPQRLEEGYGLTQGGVENCLAEFPVSLVLAVDCGSTAVETIGWLKGRGVDVVVLDHHQVPEVHPEAVAMVNPQLGPVEGKTFRELCSVGLAFKLAHAVLKRGRERGMPGVEAVDLKSYLDLVALGTIADLVPLVGENRILVTSGLEWLSRTRRPGLVALKKVAQVAGTVRGYEVGFQLAPRLNAAGRLEHARDALDLLMAGDSGEAERIAVGLDGQNRKRQKIERGILEEVIQAVREGFRSEEDFVIVEGRSFWHVGVVGIVASRVMREFYRPTIILGGDGEEWRGSGRSIEGFDLAEALRDCGDLLVRHGGHAMAAGLSIVPGKVDEFRVRLNAVAKERLKREQLQPLLRLDAEVDLAELTLERVKELEKLAPTGMSNPAVSFWVRQVALSGPPLRMGQKKQHLKLRVTDGREVREAVWWNAGEAVLPERFDLAFSPQLNEYNGSVSVQLKVLDWR